MKIPKLVKILVPIVLILAIICSVVFFALKYYEPKDNRPVIYGTYFDSDIYRSSIIDVNQTENLKEKMNEYAGQDVLFGVYVDFPKDTEFCQRYLINFVYDESTDKSISEIDNQITALKNEKDTLKQNKTQYSVDEFREKNHKITEQIKKLSAKRNTIYLNNSISAQQKAHTSAEYDLEVAYVTELVGSENMIPLKNHSDISDFTFTNAYFLKLSADVINELLERGKCNIYLALPNRTGDYDKKISDTLTYYLEKADDYDTLDVAVVTTADKLNSFAIEQGFSTKNLYNRSLYKMQSGLATSFLENIIERNGINGKCRFSNNKSIAKLGFNATLTKAEILSLVNDPDVKVIYLAGNKNYIPEDYDIYSDYVVFAFND